MRAVSTLFKERFAVDFKIVFIDFFRISKVNEFASNLEIVEKDSWKILRFPSFLPFADQEDDDAKAQFYDELGNSFGGRFERISNRVVSSPRSLSMKSGFLFSSKRTAIIFSSEISVE